MRGLKAFWPMIAIAVVALLIMLLAEPVSRWIAANRSAYNGIVVGYIVHAEGSVRRIHGAEVDLVPSPTDKKMEIRDGDRVQTSIQSKATLVLNSGDEFEIGSGTNIQFQLWNAKDAASPIYVNWLLGSLELSHPGVHGKCYVVKDGRLYLPGQKPTQKAMALTVLRNAPLDMHLAADPVGKQDFESDTSAASGDDSSTPPPAIAAEPETLANEYIDETVAAHQNQLQKCWLSRLKDVGATKGQIVVQFEISKRGKVKEAKIADASLNDEVLQKCVVTVFERIQFRSFKGTEISLSYPVNFE